MFVKIGVAMVAIAIAIPVLCQVEQPPASSGEAPVVAPEKVWPQEPDGFRGVTFGTPYSEASKKLLAPQCKSKQGRRPHDVVLECSHPSFSLTAKASAEAKFFYVKGSGAEPEFNGVELRISNRQFKEVKAMLLLKYGPPLMQDDKVSTSSALFGTGEADKYYEWLGEHARAVVIEAPQPFARSRVTIERISDPTASQELF